MNHVYSFPSEPITILSLVVILALRVVKVLLNRKHISIAKWTKKYRIKGQFFHELITPLAILKLDFFIIFGCWVNFRLFLFIFHGCWRVVGFGWTLLVLMNVYLLMLLWLSIKLVKLYSSHCLLTHSVVRKILFVFCWFTIKYTLLSFMS